MNLKFRIRQNINPYGEISREPLIDFDDNLLDKSWIISCLYENDDDYNALEFIKRLDNYQDYLSNPAPWYAGDGGWYVFFDKEGNITIADDKDQTEGYPKEELLPSVTMSITDFKQLLLDYRKRAKEFREQLPEMQKDEDQRRLAESFGFM